MKMRKILSVLTVSALCVSMLAGCGGGSGDTSSNNAGNSNSTNTASDAGTAGTTDNASSGDAAGDDTSPITLENFGLSNTKIKRIKERNRGHIAAVSLIQAGYVPSVSFF